MPAFLEFAGRGTGPYPVHQLPFLDPDYLSATIDDVPVAITVDVPNRLVTLASSAAGTSTVRIQRTTPRDQDDRLTQFLDLATGSAGLTGALLDQDYRQLLHLAVEARDIVEALEPPEGMMLNDDGQWEAESLRIENAADAELAGDALTKGQLDAQDGFAGDLPTVGVPDNDNGLFVAAGVWDNRTPAQCRTSLGLGSAALLDHGTSANNAVRFDSSARYPAADGRNIDLANNATVNARSLATVIRFTRDLQSATGPGLDPAVNTWSHNSSSRLAFTGGTPLEVALNNGGSDLVRNATSVTLLAGTWIVRWHLKVEAGNNNLSFGWRVTNDDDTSSQTVYYDASPVKVLRQQTAAQVYWWLHTDEIVLKLAASTNLCFRRSMLGGAANSDMESVYFFRKVSQSFA